MLCLLLLNGNKQQELVAKKSKRHILVARVANINLAEKKAIYMQEIWHMNKPLKIIEIFAQSQNSWYHCMSQVVTNRCRGFFLTKDIGSGQRPDV